MSSKKTTDFGLLIALIGALVVLPAVSSGCTDAQKEQMAAQAEKRKRQMAEKVLKDRALEYWELLRWESWSQAATYLEDEQEQLLFLRSQTDASRSHTPIQDVEIEYVFIGTEADTQGEIRIRWTEVAVTEGRVASRTSTQGWYKSHGRWWVEPGSPMGHYDEGSFDESALNEEPPADLPTTSEGP